MNNQILLIGGFVEIIELCVESGINIVGIVDNSLGNSYKNLPIVGSDDNVLEWRGEFLNCKLLISPDSPDVRKTLVNHYKYYGFKFTNLISKYARVSKSAFVGLGSVIQAGTNVSSEVHIGEFVKINSNATIMHNSSVGDFTTIAPSAVILGHVKIGELCYIGANATILPHVSVSNNVIIGAGAVVTKDIKTPYTTYAGVPASILKNNIDT